MCHQRFVFKIIWKIRKIKTNLTIWSEIFIAPYIKDLNYSVHERLVAKQPKGTRKIYSRWSFKELEDDFRSTGSLQCSTMKSSRACQTRDYGTAHMAYIVLE
jgi:hypothetical protein